MIKKATYQAAPERMSFEILRVIYRLIDHTMQVTRLPKSSCGPSKSTKASITPLKLRRRGHLDARYVTDPVRRLPAHTAD